MNEAIRILKARQTAYLQMIEAKIGSGEEAEQLDAGLRLRLNEMSKAIGILESNVDLQFPPNVDVIKHTDKILHVKSDHVPDWVHKLDKLHEMLIDKVSKLPQNSSPELPEIYIGQKFQIAGKKFIPTSDHHGNNIGFTETE